MRIAEEVTFGGLGGLDRAAHLRGDGAQIEALAGAPGARVLPIWRGKPMVEGEGLGLVTADHPVLGEAKTAPIFLGLAPGGAPRFARDVSSWRPDEMPETLNAFLDTSQQCHPTFTGTQGFAELRSIMTRLSPLEAEMAATARALLNWHRSHGFCAACGAPSEISMAGWQRSCPGCGTPHFPRTDPVVIMLITHGNSVLMGRSPGWPEGMYSLLAGFVEPGETLEGAVRREVFEESGIEVGAVRYLASQPWAFPSSLMIGCAGAALGREITLDPVELEDALWVSREEMAEVFAETHPKLKRPRRGAIAEFLVRNWLADRLD